MTAEDDRPPTPPDTEAPTVAPRPSRTVRVTTFQPNDLVAGRFAIVRFIAAGGMGEVYEAEDLLLKERVALKTVRPEIAEDRTVMERFRREIQLARRVTHPSVCRTFDLFRHRLAPPPDWEGPTPEVTLLSMELLEGETLGERIRRTGPLATEEALPILTQVAAALAAAHEAGIVHRDFKSANVQLVPAKKAEGGVRAVVADFGLARGGATTAGGGASMTATGALAGTPAYMAPEQVEGGEIAPATDVYALGVVMYEMVTGKRPFEGDTPLQTAIKRLNEKPPSPRTHVPSLDSRWEATILRCLERDPADRFAGTIDVVKALGGGFVAPSAKQKRRARRRIALAAGALLAGAGALAVRLLPLMPSRPPMLSQTPAVASRRSIAVLGFKNLSRRGDAAWLTRALAEMLTMELGAGEKLRTIPGENVARMKVELSLPEADSLAPDTLSRIRANLGTDLVVLGSYFASGKDAGGTLRLDLQVQDTAHGETIASVTQTGTVADLLDLVSRAGSDLRRKLGLGELSAAESDGARAALPANPTAARLYAEGLGKLRLFDASAARELLAQAAAAEPDSSLVHSALADAWSALGYDEKAKQEAKKALDLSTKLSREERLWVEGRYYEAVREWDKATATYRTLWGFFPDNLEYGLLLASAQTSGGKGKEALATVEGLRGLPSPAREDPRIDLAEATVSNSLGDYRRAQSAAARAAEKGNALGARLLVARARMTEGLALRTLGEQARATAANDEAQRLFAEAGDRKGVAQALLQTATVQRYEGDLEPARSTAERALGIARQIGDKLDTGWAENRIAGILVEQGRLDDGLKMYEQTLATWREIEDKNGEGTALNNIGETLWKRGDLSSAQKTLEEGLALVRSIGSRRAQVFTLFNLGFVRYDEGDLAAARSAFEESLDISRRIGEESLGAVALFGLGRVLRDEGDLAGARKAHEESLASRRKLKERGRAAESLVALASLSIDEGRGAEAEAQAREALAEFHKRRVSYNEARALAALGGSLLAQGKGDEAKQAITRAVALAEKTEHRAAWLSVALTASRVRAALGERAPAVTRLNAVLSEATRHGFLRLQLEARLALGEIEMKAGKTVAGRARLQALETEASARGFALIARKSNRLLS